jgi:hypothetical protein
MKKSILKVCTNTYRKYPTLRPILDIFYNKFILKPTYSGSGISCFADLPWNGTYNDKIFKKSFDDLKKLSFNSKEVIYSDLESAKWKLWIMSFATRFAIQFAKTENYVFVECGVAEGLSTFISIREIKAKINDNYVFHLYDSWGTMRLVDLVESELTSKNKYSTLDINITKRNLSEFEDNLIFHQGYIPESFNVSPEPPNNICYIHIDLNAAKPTLSALEFFYPKLVEGGVILFDDYGVIGHPDTKKTVDEFLMDKGGIFLKEPTGQAIFFKK